MRDLDGFYDIPEVGRLPSVTTILQVIGKGFQLLKWYESKGTKKACEVLTQVKEMSPFIHDAIVRGLPGDFFETGSDKLKESSSVGSTAHMYFDNWMKGIRWRLDEVPERVYGSCKIFLETVGREKFEVLKSECTVYSKRYGYAGTLDAVIKDEDGKIILRDWKTSGSLYPEMKLQSVAYLYACRELTKEKIDAIEIMRFDRDGSMFDPKKDILRVSDDELAPLFKIFLHVFELWKWMEANKK